jgi:hypothetical protein
MRQTFVHYVYWGSHRLRIQKKKARQPGGTWLSGFLAGVVRDAFVSDDET